MLSIIYFVFGKMSTIATMAGQWRWFFRAPLPKPKTFLSLPTELRIQVYEAWIRMDPPIIKKGGTVEHTLLEMFPEGDARVRSFYRIIFHTVPVLAEPGWQIDLDDERFWGFFPCHDRLCGSAYRGRLKIDIAVLRQPRCIEIMPEYREFTSRWSKLHSEEISRALARGRKSVDLWKYPHAAGRCLESLEQSGVLRHNIRLNELARKIVFQEDSWEDIVDWLGLFIVMPLYALGVLVTAPVWDRLG
jgi:hypothetical protein